MEDEEPVNQDSSALPSGTQPTVSASYEQQLEDQLDNNNDDAVAAAVVSAAAGVVTAEEGARQSSVSPELSSNSTTAKVQCSDHSRDNAPDPVV